VKCWVFVGPTAFGLGLPALLRRGDRVLPPAGRGDVDRLLGAVAAPAAIVLVDGQFQDRPAVGHAELCRALDAGWSVWGCSSLGAIRAWELRHAGMRGCGWVHDQFAQHTDFADDEMALLHFPQPPWFAVSEPLVNLRHALHEVAAAGIVSSRAQAAVLRSLRRLWFGERTRPRMRAALEEAGKLDGQQIRAVMASLEQRPIKRLDLESLLVARPWAAGPP
jgi:hypothetical protein